MSEFAHLNVAICCYITDTAFCTILRRLSKVGKKLYIIHLYYKIKTVRVKPCHQPYMLCDCLWAMLDNLCCYIWAIWGYFREVHSVIILCGLLVLFILQYNIDILYTVLTFHMSGNRHVCINMLKLHLHTYFPMDMQMWKKKSTIPLITTRTGIWAHIHKALDEQSIDADDPICSTAVSSSK